MITEILQHLNLILMFNSIFGEGIGELITFLSVIYTIISPIAFLGFIILTKEVALNILKARLQNKSIGEIPLPDGHKEFVLIPKGVDSFKYKISKDNEITWIINSDAFKAYGNGVRHTILHPDIPNNISIDQLVDYALDKSENVILSPADNMVIQNNLASFKAKKIGEGYDIMKYTPFIVITGLVILGIYMVLTNYHPAPGEVKCVFDTATAAKTVLSNSTGLV